MLDGSRVGADSRTANERTQRRGEDGNLGDSKHTLC